jgi:hypothetical protein
MAVKRDLVDAVSDRQVKKTTSPLVRSRKRRNHNLLKLCISLAFGFVGGYAVGRWIRIL